MLFFESPIIWFTVIIYFLIFEPRNWGAKQPFDSIKVQYLVFVVPHPLDSPDRMNLINVLGVATDRKILQKGQKDRGVYRYDDERCLRWSLSLLP
ncbi:hypothetical protein [Nostoc sp. DSM 114160]